ncbi:hypothetical protein FQR65_LT05987 [Abscondita terminalis]|nr:hypothetical protein FQR65_LT05987 [Abscondita terminalis]
MDKSVLTRRKADTVGTQGRKTCSPRQSEKDIEPKEACTVEKMSTPVNPYPFIIMQYEKLEEMILVNCSSQIWNLDETSLSSDTNRVKVVAEIGQKIHRNMEGYGKKYNFDGLHFSGWTLLPLLIIFQGVYLWTS